MARVPLEKYVGNETVLKAVAGLAEAIEKGVPAEVTAAYQAAKKVVANPLEHEFGEALHGGQRRTLLEHAEQLKRQFGETLETAEGAAGAVDHGQALHNLQMLERGHVPLADRIPPKTGVRPGGPK